MFNYVERQSRYFSNQWRWLFLLITYLLLSACATQPTSQVLPTGILWKIEKSGTESSYLLGTIHSEDSRVLAVFDKIKDQFYSSRMLSLEVSLDKSAAKEAAASMFYSDQRQLADEIGRDRYDKVVKVLKDRGFPAFIVARMKPWAAFTNLNMPESGSGVFLDAMLYHKAQQAKMGFTPLETMSEQTALFDQLPLVVQIQLLDDTLEHLQELDDDLAKAIDAYLSRDLNKIAELQNDFLKRTSPELHSFYVEKLIDNRNRNMAERMQPILVKGNAFIAVGALHLPGANGLLNLLTKAGYRLSPVY